MASLQRASHHHHHHHQLCLMICASSVLLLILFSKELRDRQQQERHRRDQDLLLDSTEIPAEHIDPAAIDLTPLVNTLINTSQSGSRQLFSLLSVTSYSSLALHKLTLLVYNISNVRGIESNTFRRRFCYCVTNETNDLTDFTAILLDVMGNSTTYLQELFKSASILSVSQRNNSDCIYICVMAGKTGRETPALWEVDSITPLFNQTIVEGPHRGNVSSIRLPVAWHQLPTHLSHVSPSGPSSTLTSPVHAPAHVSPPKWTETAASASKIPTDELLDTSPQPVTMTTQRQTTDDAAQTATTRGGTTHAPTEETQKPTFVTILQPITSTEPTTTSPGTSTSPAHLFTASPDLTAPPPGSSLTLRASTDLPTTPPPARPTGRHTAGQRTTDAMSRRTTTPRRTEETEKPGCPWRRTEVDDVSASGRTTTTTTVSAHKLQPCVLELCKFFSQCLCRPFSPKSRMKRYCDDSHLWYEQHTSEVCRRVRRVSFSRNLKQRCLMKMCNKL
ncbi:HERV-H LTR-associating protein 1 [Halichoeres trimaculatus]|uniref:HERV-H LTR-associating protein 1 n=1 Tax=Halichoeres trimaculatus TaxID=147232 RepID=UPI003D9ED77D